MQLNNKGYTLIELLATMLILGILMAVTIPNITGISTQNKVTAYAEDAKKFKNIVEYKLRGDNTVKKPTSNEQCVIVALNLVHGSEFDNPPYGGTYMMDKSFVVMVKKNKRFDYYVQLVEDLGSSKGYKGYGLIDSAKLEGTKYFDYINEDTVIDGNPFVDFDLATLNSRIRTITGCTNLLEVYKSV